MTGSGTAADPEEAPGREAFQALAGGPRLQLEELRKRLHLSAESFIDVWEGRSELHGPARRRLAHLVREEIEWYQELLIGLERERAEEAARVQRQKDREVAEDEKA